jgi:dipeptidyl-peptidase-4
VASSDQSQAVKNILGSRPYIDPAKVAVWGWSGGGSMSLNALFRYPDIYNTAISVAPVPDMKYYDTIYQERYMATPAINPEGYRDGSPINYAKYMNDSQNLLVIHGQHMSIFPALCNYLVILGTGDDNCHYQGTEALINELVKFNKPFQMLSYPNRSHSISEGENTSRHLFEQMTRFFKQCGQIAEI